MHMEGLSLRRRACVLCGEAIVERGRMDRMYCSSSCRTLAWKARKQAAAGGAVRSSRAAEGALPGYAPRGSLVQLAQRLEADRERAQRELAAAQAQIARLTAELEGSTQDERSQAGLLAAQEARLREQDQAMQRMRAQEAALQNDLRAAYNENEQLVARWAAAQQRLEQAASLPALHAAQAAELARQRDAAIEEKERLAARLAEAQQSVKESPTRIQLLTAQQAERTARAQVAKISRQRDEALEENGQLAVRLAEAQRNVQESPSRIQLLTAQQAERTARARAAELEQALRAAQHGHDEEEKTAAALRADCARLEQALRGAEERALQAEAGVEACERQSSQQIRDLRASRAAAQAAQELAEECLQRATQRQEAAEAALRAEEEAHKATRAQVQKLEATLASPQSLRGPTAGHPPAELMPAEQVAARALRAYETSLRHQDPERAGEAQAFFRESGELLRKFAGTIVMLVRKMRAAGETDATALALRALDRTRAAFLRSLDGNEGEPLHQYVQQIKRPLTILAELIAARVEEEVVPSLAGLMPVRPWSERAGQVLDTFLEQIRRLSGSDPATAEWLDAQRPFFQHFAEAVLERASRGAERGAIPTTSSQHVAECVEEVGWRYFDTEREAAQWAQQNNALLSKLAEWLLRR